MGLDNIPAEYPCVRERTAMRDGENRIDCEETQAQGGCPWQRDKPADGTPIHGMLGADCWYRGKAGTRMLETLASAGHQLSPEHCEALAAWMVEHGEAYLALVAPEDREQEARYYRYAAWWLGWIAQAGGGATAWW
jgi:hypothetical protein